MAPIYLITAASGHIGQRLVPLLLSLPSEPSVVLPTTNAKRLSSNLAEGVDKSRVHVVEGNMQDPNFVEATLKEHKVTGVFLCLTSDNELFTTFNFLDSIRRAPTVKHLVYLSGSGDFGLDAVQNGLLKKTYAAHVAVKYMCEAKLMYGLPPRTEEGGYSWTIIGPSLFFDNDLRSKNAILKDGYFDEPLGAAGVSRVDPEDIALAAAKALEDDGQRWGGKKVSIGSLKTYTNEDVAKLWSKALGKDIRPAMSDKSSLDQFERHYTKTGGPAWGRDLRLMYEMFNEYSFSMTEADYRNQVALLGKEPASYEEFVERTANGWKAEV